MTRAIACPHCHGNVAMPPEPLDDLLEAVRITSQHAATEQQQRIEDYLAALEEFYAPSKGARR